MTVKEARHMKNKEKGCSRSFIFVTSRTQFRVPCLHHRCFLRVPGRRISWRTSWRGSFSLAITGQQGREDETGRINTPSHICVHQEETRPDLESFCFLSELTYISRPHPGQGGGALRTPQQGSSCHSHLSLRRPRSLSGSCPTDTPSVCSGTPGTREKPVPPKVHSGPDSEGSPSCFQVLPGSPSDTNLLHWLYPTHKWGICLWWADSGPGSHWGSQSSLISPLLVSSTSRFQGITLFSWVPFCFSRAPMPVDPGVKVGLGRWGSILLFMGEPGLYSLESD